jgi:hypothetical protein
MITYARACKPDWDRIAFLSWWREALSGGGKGEYMLGMMI